jgi:hypothetical protein
MKKHDSRFDVRSVLGVNSSRAVAQIMLPIDIHSIAEWGGDGPWVRS